MTSNGVGSNRSVENIIVNVHCTTNSSEILQPRELTRVQWRTKANWCSFNHRLLDTFDIIFWSNILLVVWKVMNHFIRYQTQKSHNKKNHCCFNLASFYEMSTRSLKPTRALTWKLFIWKAQAYKLHGILNTHTPPLLYTSNMVKLICIEELL